MTIINYLLVGIGVITILFWTAVAIYRIIKRILLGYLMVKVDYLEDKQTDLYDYLDALKKGITVTIMVQEKNSQEDK